MLIGCGKSSTGCVFTPKIAGITPFTAYFTPDISRTDIRLTLSHRICKKSRQPLAYSRATRANSRRTPHISRHNRGITPFTEPFTPFGERLTQTLPPAYNQTNRPIQNPKPANINPFSIDKAVSGSSPPLRFHSQLSTYQEQSSAADHPVRQNRNCGQAEISNEAHAALSRVPSNQASG